MRILAALLLALMLAGSAVAANPPAQTMQPLDTKSAADVAAVQQYLNTIKTMQAKFIQTSGDGKQAAGEFTLRRPGKMRFQYASPVKDFIVADGMFVHYYDSAMKQGSRTLITKSLADFFLREKLTLAGDLQVSTVTRDGAYLMVKLVEAKDPNAGSLTLALTEKPMALKKWRIVDPQGVITEVELFDAVTNTKVNNDLFHYYDPEHTKERLNK